MSQDSYLNKLVIIYALGFVIFLCGIPFVQLMEKKGLKKWTVYLSGMVLIPFVFLSGHDNTIKLQGFIVMILADVYYRWKFGR